MAQYCENTILFMSTSFIDSTGEHKNAFYFSALNHPKPKGTYCCAIPHFLQGNFPLLVPHPCN